MGLSEVDLPTFEKGIGDLAGWCGAAAAVCSCGCLHLTAAVHCTSLIPVMRSLVHVTLSPGQGGAQQDCHPSSNPSHQLHPKLIALLFSPPNPYRAVPNEIDLIAASFVRKGSDLDYIRKVCAACTAQHALRSIASMAQHGKWSRAGTMRLVDVYLRRGWQAHCKLAAV